ncbi:MAG TPA: phosphodiesterase, partial [Porphyromonadaceae bacterium]|nr:phosphodiesterase [Porphyromonadaceae bacterium]
YDVMLFGHTHLWMLEEKDEVLCCNPGSIALPKEGRPATFALIEDGQVSVRTLHEGEILALYKVN